jgi:DNA-binding MarR family transcriptional regulator
VVDRRPVSGARRDELNKALEELHFAFRAVVARPDSILGEHGLSRMHHRVLYFIGRNRMLSVNDLRSLLGISKQALNGPLRELIRRGLVSTSPSPLDRRVKRLHLTTRGTALEERLSGDQRDRFARVFKAVGPEKENAWREVMRLLAKK